MDNITIENIEFKDLSEIARAKFEKEGRILIKPRNFDKIMFNFYEKITFPNEDITYITQELKTIENYGKELRTYLFEENKFGEKIGDGNIRYNKWSKDKYFKEKPFIGYTLTEEKFLGKGYAFRRFLTMKFLTEKYFGLPLYSDTQIKKTIPIWEKAVKYNIAVQENEGKKLRFHTV